MAKFFKFIIIIGLMALIPIFWINLDWFGITLTWRVGVVGGGASLFVFGVLYKLLGSWDLIPDWIPLLGKVDDWLAWVLMIIGVGVAVGGWFLTK